MKFLKNNLITILLVMIFVTGLGLLIYPTFSDYWNSLHQSRAIASYAESVANIDNDTYDHMMGVAKEYNRRILNRRFHLNLSEKETKAYERVLDVTGTGIMSYIEIPKIGCSLPIYHGTDEGVLQIAVGHLAGTAMPVGGIGTHCVLSGHRGLPSAKLFTDIDQLVAGDEFYIRTLDETLTYEVDQILIVLPEQVDDLAPIAGKDLCTLVTCTPYGINTHRLLVRGHRIETTAVNRIRVTADAIQIDETIVAPIIEAPILLVLIIIMTASTNRKRKFNRKVKREFNKYKQ